MALQHYLKHSDNYCATPATAATGVGTQTHFQLQHSTQIQQPYQLQQQLLTHPQQQQTQTTPQQTNTIIGTVVQAAAASSGHVNNTQTHQQLLVQSQHRLKQLQLKQPTIHQQHMTYHHQHHPYYQQSNHITTSTINTSAATHKFKGAQHNQHNYSHNRTLPIHALNQNSNFSAASSSTGGGTASSHAPTQQSNATNSSRSSAANAHSTNPADNANTKQGTMGAQARNGSTTGGTSASNSKKIKTEPLLSQYHQTERITFANSHIVWGEEHWRRVVFQDERKFNLDGPDGFSSYFHDLRNYEQTLSQRPRGNSVYIYMLITAGGPIHMEVSTVKQRPQTYIETILRERPNIIAKLGGSPDFILQDHNWAANMSPTTQEMLDAEGIKMQKWPAVAHDLNIMENIWGWLIREVYDGGRKFSRKDDLIFRIREAWTRLPMDFVVNLYSTLPERIAELYYTRGIYTNC